MTLPETMNKENVTNARRLKTLTISLTATLRQAIRRKGYTRGMKACAEHLQSDSSSVMLCILPTNCPLGIDIQHTLIKAFCLESGIAIILVDSFEKLSKLVGKLEQSLHKLEPDCRTSGDTSCFLIKHPKKDESKQDKTLIDFYHEMKWKYNPQPVLSLPD